MGNCVQTVPECWTEYIEGYNDLMDLYVTMTFRQEKTKSGSVHPEKADRKHRRFIHELNKRVFGNHYDRNPVNGLLVVRAIEYGSKGRQLHYHDLIGRWPKEMNTDVERKKLKEMWFDMAGIGRFFEYDPERGAASYLSKCAYAFKRGQIDLIGPWNHVAEIRSSRDRQGSILGIQVH